MSTAATPQRGRLSVAVRTRVPAAHWAGLQRLSVLEERTISNIVRGAISRRLLEAGVFEDETKDGPDGVASC